MKSIGRFFLGLLVLFASVFVAYALCNLVYIAIRMALCALLGYGWIFTDAGAIVDKVLTIISWVVLIVIPVLTMKKYIGK